MNKKILKLAIPNIVSNITIPLLGLVETALMGHQTNIAYLGAVALGSMVFNLIFWSFGFLRMGTVGFTAQSYGNNDKAEQITILYRAIFIGLVLSFIILLFHPFIIDGALSLTKSSVEVKTNAELYFNLKIWSTPATLIILVFSGWFIGMHNSLFPMFIALLTNLLNIVFSSYFVLVLDLKAEGAALGSLVAQYISLIVTLFLFFRKYKNLIIPINWKEIVEVKALKLFAKVNTDIFIRTIFLMLVFSYFTIGSANVSDSILAVNTVLFQFFILYSYMLDGFANAAEAITGEYIGASDKKNLIKSIRLLFKWGIAFALLFTLIYYFFGENMLRLMTDKEEILIAAKGLLGWVLLIPLVSMPAFMWDGIFIGATASSAMRNSMIFSAILFFLLLYIPWQNELTKIWFAFIIFMFARGFFLTIYFKNSIIGRIGLAKN